MSQNTYQRTKDIVQRTLNLKPLRGLAGDGQGNIYDPYVFNSGKVWVRYLVSSGYSMPMLIRGPYKSPVPLSDNQAILIEIDHEGQPYVANVDFGTNQAAGGTPFPPATIPPEHFITQDRVVTLRCSQLSTPALEIMISGWKPIINNQVIDFEGDPTFDVSGNQPASGEHCVLLLTMKSDFITPFAYTSTAVPLNDALGVDDINEALAAMQVDYTPIWAYDYSGDTTGLTDNDTLCDLRQIVNTDRFYPYTPANSADPVGAVGDRAYDDDYLYVKTGGNGWTRTALATF